MSFPSRAALRGRAAGFRMPVSGPALRGRSDLPVSG